MEPTLMTAMDMPAPQQGDAETIRVFMIDESEAVCRHIASMLAPEPNLEFAFCTEPDKALAGIDSFSPSLILLETTMTGADGFAVLDAIHNHPGVSNTPIIVLTFETSAEVRTRAFSLGAADFLNKKGNKNEFMARLRHRARRCEELRKNGVTATDAPPRPSAAEPVRPLMLDESKFACLMVKKTLAENGCEDFAFSADPAEALALAHAFRPTVIVQSFAVGDENDFRILDQFRNDPVTRDIPIIILSGSTDPNLKVQALDRGAADFVIKSKDLTELVSRIRIHSGDYHTLLRYRPEKTGELTAAPVKLKVLIVDDSKSVCFALSQSLKNEPDLEYAVCNDARLAMDKAREFLPTVILQDLEMPEIHGLELLALYRKDPVLRERPIIMLSGTRDPETKAKAFARGANDYVEKNMDRVELLSRIRYHSGAYLNALRLNDSIKDLLEAQRRVEAQSQFIKKTFGRYLSEEIVESILERPEGLRLGGEKRVISILMADLRGFTSIGERLEPETVLSIINIFLKVMTEIIFKWGGTIDEFIGDAILAMFGAPTKREDDAIRAVACALEMQLAIAGVNDRIRQEGFPEVAMGIGINTGEVVVGNIGSEKRSKYGIVGRNVNLTSRIESYTVGGQIYVSENTVQACGDILRIDGQQVVMPKGVKEPITIYEIGGIGGDHNIFLPIKQEVELIALPDPVSVLFTVLEGKHAGIELHEGFIAALAEEREATILSEIKAQPLTNLKFSLFDLQSNEFMDELYAKVISVAPDEGSFRVRFTSLPPKAETLFANLLTARTGTC